MDGTSYKSVLKFAINGVIEDIRNNARYGDSEFLQGQEVGLMLALEKLDASSFLLEQWDNLVQKGATA